MSKRSKVTLTLIMMLIMVMTQALPFEAGSASVTPQTLLIDTTENSISFLVTFPVNEITIEETQVKKDRFTEIQIPGYSTTSEVGAPQLPFLTEVLGVPFDSDVRVTVTPGREQRRQLSAPVLPVATENVEWKLPSLANSGSEQCIY